MKLPRPLEPATAEPAADVSIKDAYAQWLREVESLTRQRKGKKEKSKRLAALRHLAQPTTSSASKLAHSDSADSKDAPSPVPRSEAAAASQLEAQRRRFQSLADEASYAHYAYEPPWLPGLAFFALLASQSRSRAAAAAVRHEPLRSGSSTVARSEIAGFPVRVPPTALRLGKTDGVVLFFTTEPQPQDVKGNARRSNTAESGSTGSASAIDWTLQFHFFSTRELLENRLPWVLRILTATATTAAAGDAAPIAVLKTAMGSGASPQRNTVEPLSSELAAEQALRSLWDDETDDAGATPLKAVQTFVASKGSSASGSGGRAWIARPAYRKRDMSATTVWILTGGDHALVASTEWPSDSGLSFSSSSSSPPCQIVKCTTAQSWREPRVIAETLCPCLNLHAVRATGGAALGELVVDLVQDADGRWWLLQVKALQLRRALLPPPPSLASRARSAPDRLETSSVASSSTRKILAGFASRAKWKCAGRYCGLAAVGGDDGGDGGCTAAVDTERAAAEPSGFLTKKELLSCEFYAKFQASQDASLSSGCSGGLAHALAFFLQHQIRKRDRAALYEPQPLCAACLQHYYALRREFAAHVGLESNQDKPKALRPTKQKQARAVPPVVGLERLSPLAGSQSTPRLSVHSTLAPSVPLAAPPYMDELERIERLLAGDDGDGDAAARGAFSLEPQQQARRKVSDAPSLYDSHVTADATPPAYSSSSTTTTTSTTTTFSWQTLTQTQQHSRIEEMWRSVQLKPLRVTSAAAASSASSVRPYNTFSLDAALREAAAAPQLRRPPASKDPHLIAVADCRRVFSDEPFRESLVRAASRRLLDSRESVRFVVLPLDADSDLGAGPSEDQDLAVARMALRSLALDVAHALEQEGAARPARGLPPVVDDASGGLFMTIAAPRNP